MCLQTLPCGSTLSCPSISQSSVGTPNLWPILSFYRSNPPRQHHQNTTNTITTTPTKTNILLLLARLDDPEDFPKEQELFFHPPARPGHIPPVMVF